DDRHTVGPVALLEECRAGGRVGQRGLLVELRDVAVSDEPEGAHGSDRRCWLRIHTLLRDLSMDKGNPRGARGRHAGVSDEGLLPRGPLSTGPATPLLVTRIMS